ncbi:FecR family protein [Prosthecomicrobium sp. N25]|uniref:FecR family protein n=1 Tax=Prosthecomicrobium sp. N25 TaxID=3129254 RepID=UPI003076F7FE
MDAGFSRRSLFIAAAGLAAGAVALVQPAGRARAALRVGHVGEAIGDAFAELAAERRRLEQAADVFDGDLVSTGVQARVSMKLGSATTVRLGAEAKLRIDRFVAERGGVLDLGQGALLFDRPESAPKTDVRIRSTFGLIAVRGTRFFAGPSRGVFGVFVERGEVAVEAGGQRRVLGSGQGVDIPSPGAPPSEVKAWGAPRIREAIASVT